MSAVSRNHFLHSYICCQASGRYKQYMQHGAAKTTVLSRGRAKKRYSEKQTERKWYVGEKITCVFCWMDKVCPGGSWVSAHDTESVVSSRFLQTQQTLCVERRRRREGWVMGVSKRFVDISGVLDVDKSLCCCTRLLGCAALSCSQLCAINTLSSCFYEYVCRIRRKYGFLFF